MTDYKKDLKIAVLGLGYIGLPTAAMFASRGVHVLGYDVNESVVTSLNKGEITIEEPFLDDLVRQVVSSGRLKASTVLEESDVFIIAVPTPIKKDKGADMSYVASATEAIVPYLRKGNIVILESTSPPGSTEDIIVPILKKSNLNIGEDVFVAHSPERVIPGRILIELVENDRIVGGINDASTKAVKKLYEIFVKGEIFKTDSKTAEMCKLMENTFRDVNIALANELAKLCENMGINAWEVIELSNKHPRVNLHQPGPGVGGHCLAVDPWFIVEKDPAAQIIKLSRETNDSMPEHVMHRIQRILPDGQGKVAILGLTYKPNIDDMRESPLVDLVNELKAHTKYTLSLHDPYAPQNGELVENVYDAVTGADLMVLGVHHDRFKDLDFEKVASLMKTKRIFDTRNVLDHKALKALGFEVTLLGRA